MCTRAPGSIRTKHASSRSSSPCPVTPSMRPAAASAVISSSSRASRVALAWNWIDDGGPTGSRRTGMLTPTYGFAPMLRALRLPVSVET